MNMCVRAANGWNWSTVKLALRFVQMKNLFMSQATLEQRWKKKQRITTAQELRHSGEGESLLVQKASSTTSEAIAVAMTCLAAMNL